MTSKNCPRHRCEKTRKYLFIVLIDVGLGVSKQPCHHREHDQHQRARGGAPRRKKFTANKTHGKLADYGLNAFWATWTW